jgi:hypothetical protein
LGACAETLTLTCVRPGAEAEFGMLSSVFGKLGTGHVGQLFTDEPRHPTAKSLKLDPHVAFTIQPGTKPFGAGDSFTIELQSRRFWVGGQNPQPSLKWWTHLGYCEGTLASRKMGGWGRLEIEPTTSQPEEHFLTVMYCADPGLKEMPGSCELIQDPALEGVRLGQGGRQYELWFSSQGGAAARLKVSEGGRTVVDRPLLNLVQKEFKPNP